MSTPDDLRIHHAGFAWRQSVVHIRLFFYLGVFFLACLFIAFAGPKRLIAAQIYVSADCSLEDALLASNTNAVQGGCLAGGEGHDDIFLPAGVELSWMQGAYGEDLDRSALPPITSAITIHGNQAVLRRAAGLPCPAEDVVQNFRLLHIKATGTLTLSNVLLAGGCGVEQGGAIRNEGGVLTLLGGEIAGNYAQFGGGGLSHEAGGSGVLQQVKIISNTAVRGAGIYIENGAHLEISQAVIENNRAFAGGGLLTLAAHAVLSESQVVSNTAIHGGGVAVYGEAGGAAGVVTITHTSQISFNHATNNGGGLLVDRGRLTMDDSTLHGNYAPVGGGGEIRASVASLHADQVVSNRADDEGGGLYLSYGSQVEIVRTQFVENHASEGSGIAVVHDTRLEAADSLFLRNGAGALWRKEEGEILLRNSCVQHNMNPAVMNPGSSGIIEAAGVWWHAVDGPSGAGPGSGDAVSDGVAFVPFATTPWPDCAPSGSDLSLQWQAIPEAALEPWLPGQPVQLKLLVHNAGPEPAQDFWIDVVQVPDVLMNVGVDAGRLPAEEPGWRVALLEVGATEVLTLTAVVSPNVSSMLESAVLAVIEHSGFDPLSENNSAAALIMIAPPQILFAEINRSLPEAAGLVTFTVQVHPVNPYAGLEVVFETVDATALAGRDYVPIRTTLSFEPGQAEQSLGILLLDNAIVEAARTFHLRLLLPTGGRLGAVAQAEVTILDDDVAGVTISAEELAIVEGGAPAPFWLGLQSQPVAPVTILFESASPCHSSDALQVVPGDWEDLLPGWVLAVHDAAVTGPQSCLVSIEFVSDDPNYGMHPPLEIPVTVADIDAAALVMGLYSTVEQVIAGEDILVSAVVTNTGTVLLTDGVVYLAGTDEPALIEDLMPGESREVVWTVAIPTYTAPAEHVLSAAATAQGEVAVIVEAASLLVLEIVPREETGPEPTEPELPLPTLEVLYVPAVTFD